MGALVRYPPAAYVRARYRVAVPLSDVLLARSAFSVFWRTDTLFGTRTDASLSRRLGPASVLRLAGSAQISQRLTRGLEYGSDLTFLHAFSDTQAVATGGGLSGATRAQDPVDRYRIFVRGRQDVLRRWIFAELEPELSWPYVPGRGRIREDAVTFRLEFLFQGEPAVERAAAGRLDRLQR